MTIARAIEIFDREYQNLVDEKLKVNWLSQVDMKIYSELLKRRGVKKFSGYDESTRKTTTLLAPEEYSEIYSVYLSMQTNRVNGEIERFNNCAEIFNRLYYEMSCFISREKCVEGSAKIKAVSDNV